MGRACRAEIQAGVVSYVKRGQMPGTYLAQNNHRGLKIVENILPVLFNSRLPSLALDGLVVTTWLKLLA